MRYGDLRERTNTQPFRLFWIRTVSGTHVDTRHPGLIRLGPNNGNLLRMEPSYVCGIDRFTMSGRALIERIDRIGDPATIYSQATIGPPPR